MRTEWTENRPRSDFSARACHEDYQNQVDYSSCLRVLVPVTRITRIKSTTARAAAYSCLSRGLPASSRLQLVPPRTPACHEDHQHQVDGSSWRRVLVPVTSITSIKSTAARDAAYSCMSRALPASSRLQIVTPRTRACHEHYQHQVDGSSWRGEQHKLD